MSLIISIKLKSVGPRIHFFDIKDDMGNLVGENVTRQELKEGKSFHIRDGSTVVIIVSKGKVEVSKVFPINFFNPQEYHNVVFTDHGTSCAWKHLSNPLIYNNYYGITEPYILEYPFSYQYRDEILQNVKDYTKVFKYLDNGDKVLSDFTKYETDDAWFNKAVLYNGQQSTGILTLVPKPSNNLSIINTYPLLGTEDKTILFTKSDNFYQYNTFWSITKDISKVQFIRNLESLSIDKEVNQDNMDYSQRNYKKASMRAKDLKVRHILDNRDDINLVSQFIVTPAQNSLK